MQHATSISDLARAAGVSHSTVSRALRNSPLISAEVRERIQQLAQAMGYTPNAVAQSLQTRQTRTLGLVVTSIADPFWADVMQGVEEVARPAGFSVFLSASHNDPEQEMVAIETFRRRRVDGLLVADSRLSRQYAERLRQAEVPTVLINSQVEGQHALVHSVMVDDYGGAHTAVQYLLQLGHRAIGYIGAGNRPRSNTRRLAGYRAALNGVGIADRAGWVVVAPEEDAVHADDVAAGQALVHPLLNTGVSAIFCYNDMLAVGALMACRDHGIAVPQDLSIIGFDDIPLARYVTPPLTTICQPRRDLGSRAMHMLLDLWHDRPVASQVLAPTLIPRASTAALDPHRTT